MKNIIKKNKMIIIILIFLLVWSCINLIEYAKELKLAEKNYNDIANECKINIDYIPTCEDYLNKSYQKPDTITSFFYILCHYNLNLLQVIAPIFIIIPAIWNFHKKLKSGYIKNALTRESYRIYITKELLDSMKCIIIFPIMLIFLLIGCYIISGHFDYSQFKSILVINEKFLDNLTLTMVVYFINLMLHSIFYINLGLIFCKKNRNILVSIISSFICFVLLDIFFEVFLGSFLFGKIFKLHGFVALFNLFGIWIYTDYTNLLSVIIFSILLVVISFIILLIEYRKKEDVVICCEE